MCAALGQTTEKAKKDTKNVKAIILPLRGLTVRIKKMIEIQFVEVI